MARTYDHTQGGFHNLETDRIAADKIVGAYPSIRPAARAARAFAPGGYAPRRTWHGQSLDTDSGLPTVGNAHKAVQAANPAAPILYVDTDPVTVAHALAALVDNPYATAIQGDASQPVQVLDHEEVKKLLEQPKRTIAGAGVARKP